MILHLGLVPESERQGLKSCCVSEWPLSCIILFFTFYALQISTVTKKHNWMDIIVTLSIVSCYDYQNVFNPQLISNYLNITVRLKRY